MKATAVLCPRGRASQIGTRQEAVERSQVDTAACEPVPSLKKLRDAPVLGHHAFSRSARASDGAVNRAYARHPLPWLSRYDRPGKLNAEADHLTNQDHVKQRPTNPRLNVRRR
jgi:hypothetical protein